MVGSLLVLGIGVNPLLWSVLSPFPFVNDDMDFFLCVFRCGKLKKLILNDNRLITLPDAIHFLTDLEVNTHVFLKQLRAGIQ